MAITSLDAFVASAKQQITLKKTAALGSVAIIPWAVFHLAGQPGAGTLAVGNTTSGIVPTDANDGYPDIINFGEGNKGYLSAIDFSNTVVSRLMLFDTVFSAGAFAYNANVTLSDQPSYSGRMPGGTDFGNTELWLEAVTAHTGNQSIAIGYTNQAGVSGRSTGTVATAVAPTVGRMLRLPLQAGDSGISRIDSVVATGSSAGTFNVHVLRRLWSGRVGTANASEIHDMLRTGLVEVFQDSALRLVVQADSTSTGLPEALIEIANG